MRKYASILLLLFLFCQTANAGKNFAIIPTIHITASVNTPICPGTPVTFTATITGGGSSPVFQWKKNYNDVGANSPVYSDNTLKNGDVIVCILISSDPAANPDTVYSNYESIVVNDGQPATISTIGGTGGGGLYGDFFATNTIIYSVSSLCFDSKGNLYYVEQNTNWIKKIDVATGMVIRLTGQGGATMPAGQSDYSGDGGPAINARISYPMGICIDSYDNLIFVDCWNNRVRKIDAATGIITTIAGNGLQDTLGDGGLAVNATLFFPSGICIDSADNIYIMDSRNRRIRKVGGTTGVITTIARLGGSIPVNSSSGFGFAHEFICIGPCNELYITTYEGNLIRKVNPSTGAITTVAGFTGQGFGFNGNGVSAVNALLNHPWNLTFDKWGNLYFCDNRNNRIRKIAAGTGIITTLTGNGTPVYGGDNGPASNATIWWPYGIAIDKAGNLYFGDETSRIRKITSVIANVPAVAPKINAADTILCSGNSVTLDIKKCGDSLYGLNAAKEWKWYKDVCGGTAIGTGSAITVSPTVTTTYYVRGEGDCIQPGACDSIIIYVYQPSSASVNISANPSGVVCRGSDITFTATPSNGGSSPQYQWKRNGVNIAGANANTFTSNTLSHNDVITCELTSNQPCVTLSTVSSNAININFYPDNVTISPRNTVICTNGSVQLNASGGLAYQWYLNGSAIAGATASSYTASQAGAYLVRVTNVNCVIPDSSVVVLNVPNATLTSPNNFICKGKTQLLTASGGVSYQWYFNNAILPGVTSNAYAANQPGTYRVDAFDGFCTAGSNSITLTQIASQNSTRYPIVRVAYGKPYTLSSRPLGQIYLWEPSTELNNVNINNPIVTATQDRLYTVTISSATDCPIVDTVLVQVFNKPDVYIPTAFTPDGNGKNDVLRPIPVHIKEITFFKIFNRWGEIVFQTTTQNEGWDGNINGKPAPTGIYVWIYEAKDVDGRVLKGKGTTVLIR